MIVAESPPSFVPRGLMVLLVLLQGTVVLAWMLRAWIRPRAARRLQLPTQSAPTPTCSPPRSLLDWSILNVALHTLHYADNIYYPVRYCEPEWLYRAYALTEMELTFGFFTPLMALAARRCDHPHHAVPFIGERADGAERCKSASAAVGVAAPGPLVRCVRVRVVSQRSLPRRGAAFVLRRHRQPHHHRLVCGCRGAVH